MLADQIDTVCVCHRVSQTRDSVRLLSRSTGSAFELEPEAAAEPILSWRQMAC